MIRENVLYILLRYKHGKNRDRRRSLFRSMHPRVESVTPFISQDACLAQGL